MTLLVLVGLKGSGKTHVGAVLEARLGVCFIRVEPIFLALRNQVEAFTEVERQVDRALTEARVVAIESTGIATEHLRTLQQRYQPVRLIRVDASAETCMRRFKARDASGHVPIREERFREINARAARASFDWDCVLNNDCGLTDDEIAEEVAPFCS
jgi:dephospho-CoA kinase